MIDLLLTFVRLIVLVILYIILFTVSARVNNPPALRQLFTPEQLNQAAIALPIVSLIMTLMLAYLALRSRWHGWKLAGALSLIFYVLYTFLSWIELLAFPAVSSQMPKGFLTPGMLIQGLILAIPFSFLSVWILGKIKEDASENEANDRLQIYTSMFGMLIGTAIAISQWQELLIGAVIFLLGTALRIRAEEQLLVDAFGDAYRNYALTVPALIPGWSLSIRPRFASKS